MSFKSNFMKILSVLVVIIMVFGLVVPVFAAQMVKNGTFTGGISQWNNSPTDGTYRPWGIISDSIQKNTNARAAYLWQCVNISTPPDSNQFILSADFFTSTDQTSVEFHFFFDPDTCVGKDISSTSEAYVAEVTPADREIPGFVAPFATAVVIKAICPATQSCRIDNISLDGSDTTNVSLNTMRASSGPGWVVTLGLSALVISALMIAYWQLRRYSELG